MSEEIEVGEYVRTKSGNIFKIIGGNSDNYDIDIDYGKLEKTEINWFESNRYNDNGYFFTDNDIKNHSPNITDLIEVRRLCEWSESLWRKYFKWFYKHKR